MRWQKSACLVVTTLALANTPLRAQGDRVDAGSVNPASPIAPAGAAKIEGSNQRPVPSGHGVSRDYDSPIGDPSLAEPDRHTLASVEESGVGSLETVRNHFDPSVVFTQGGQTGYPGSSGPIGLASMTIAGGRANFFRDWNRYQLSVIYNGGETLYQPQILPNWAYHNFDLGQEISWSRWLLRVRYNFLASPQADFGGQGMGGPGMWGGAAVNPGDLLPPAIGINFLPSETILTGQAMRLRHTALAEVDYAWSRRTGLTVSYAHGLTGGSGVLFGAQSHIATAVVSDRLTRSWTASLTGGYARNSGLRFPGVASPSYNTWFSGANVGRQMNRRFYLSFNYGVERQTSTAACPVAFCATDAYQHTFGMTVRWHLLSAE